jgi:hypothetical protein
MSPAARVGSTEAIAERISRLSRVKGTASSGFAGEFEGGSTRRGARARRVASFLAALNWSPALLLGHVGALVLEMTRESRELAAGRSSEGSERAAAAHRTARIWRMRLTFSRILRLKVEGFFRRTIRQRNRDETVSSFL